MARSRGMQIEQGPNNNCVSCVLAATRRLTGKDPMAVAEPSTGPQNPNALLPEYPWGFTFDTSIAQVKSELLEQGDNSVAAIVLAQNHISPGAANHVIVAANIDGEVIFVDPQLGAIVELSSDLETMIDVRYR